MTPQEKKMTSKLDTMKMLQRIDELVSVDAGETWSWKAAEHKSFTQEESEEMASIIGSAYMVAHCVHCEACAPKWFKAPRDNTEPKEVRSNNGNAVQSTPYKERNKQ